MRVPLLKGALGPGSEGAEVPGPGVLVPLLDHAVYRGLFRKTCIIHTINFIGKACVM